MRKNLIFVILAVVIIVACNKENKNVNTVQQPLNNLDLNAYASMGLDSPFLHPDTANVMIESYLDSRPNSNKLKSLIVDANALRYYLENTDITHLKIMFAHKQNYIYNLNGDGVDCGLDYQGLTIVIAGLDDDNDFVYSAQGAVMDFASPCPHDCPTSGTGASDLLN